MLFHICVGFLDVLGERANLVPVAPYRPEKDVSSPFGFMKRFGSFDEAFLLSSAPRNCV